MKLRVSARIGFIILAVLWLSVSGQAITLTGFTSPNLRVSALAACPEHPGCRCYSTAYDVQPLTYGHNSYFETAWNTVLPGEWYPDGWSLQFASTPLDATLNITTYHAYNDPPSNNSYGLAGTELQVNWTPSSTQQDLKWIQAIYTNRPKRDGFQCYIDVLPLKQGIPPIYPYIYSDYHFYDKPGRWCETDQHIFWNAYLYLARVDRTTKSTTIYEGLSWGYTIDCEAVPEPSSIVSLVFGTGLWAIGIILQPVKQRLL